MAHHHAGRMVEAVDQKAAFVVDRKAEGPDRALHALSTQPLLCRGKEGSEDFRVVDSFQKAEVASLVLMDLQAQAVDLRADAPDRLLAAPCDPQACIAMVEPGGLFGIQMSPLLPG